MRATFASKNDPKAMSLNTLEDQIRRTRANLGLPSDAGLHALRHSFLTRAGKVTQNVKALQLLAGHSNVATTMKYIHPEESDLFGIVSAITTSAAKKPSRKAVTADRSAPGTASADW